MGIPGLAQSLNVADESGILIDNIHTDSPAASAGILPGDYITNVNGDPVENGVDFARAVGGKSPGTAVEFTLIRYGNEQNMSVTLKEQPKSEVLNNPKNYWPGLNIMPITNQVRNQAGIPSSVEGVVAFRVLSNTPVATAGIRSGDVITAINGESASDAISFYRALNNAGDSVTFDINRRGREIGIRVNKQ
jgi:serine protease Do